MNAGADATNRCVIVTNIPSPYRNPVYERLPTGRFEVVFCARSEGNRLWQLPAPRFAHRFLRERVSARPDGFNFVHNNPDIWATLNRLRPAVVVTTGMNPTHLYAFGWARTHGVRHVYMTDGTLSSEAGMGWKHRAMRRVVFSGTSAFVVASLGGADLLQSYGIKRGDVYRSPLCADNDRFASVEGGERVHDVMFCGQLHDRKLPFLFADTCAALVRRRGQCRALVVGDGPLRHAVLERLAAGGVEVTHPGFIQPQALAPWYANAKLLLFTTRMDPWGVVANEAMAAGTPVITTPFAGVVGDLVIDGENGLVLPPEAETWAAACASLLDDPARWSRLSSAARAQVAHFSYDAAAQGIVDACDHALRAQ